MSVEEKIRELLEATAPGKSGVKAEPMPKIAKNKEDGDMEDTGPAVTDPEQAKGPDASKKVKKAAVPGGEANKGEPSIKPGATKVKAEEVEEDEDKDEIVETAKDNEEMKEKKKKLAAMKHDDEEMKEELKALEDAKAEIEEKIKSISVKEDIDALTEGEELSEEFKEKAATVFEAAVKSKMRSEVERLSEAYQAEKDQEVETFKEEITEKVDTYLNYVVEEWTKENELAIERGLKGEIAEDFISGLKQLFEDHYIDVPDEKYDVLEAQSDKIAELEDRLNEEIQKNVEMSQENSELVREQLIAEVSDDLADTEIEKFKSLTEDVDFNGEEAFKEKLITLKESYFPKVTSTQSSAGTYIDDEQGGTAQDVDTTDAMKRYMSAISRDHKASA